MSIRSLALLGLLLLVALTAGCGGGGGGGETTPAAAPTGALAVASASPSPTGTPSPSPSPSPSPTVTPTPTPSPSPAVGNDAPPAPPPDLPVAAAPAAAPPAGDGFLGLRQGWNLVTLPADTVTAASAERNLYAWQEGAYVQIDPSRALPGVAYFAYSQEDAGTLAFAGSRDSQILTVPLQAGWNLVGFPTPEPVPQDSVTLDGGPLTDLRLFAFVNGTYVAHTADFQPRQGYWIHSPRAGTLSAPAPRRHLDLGMNLDVNRDWARELVFVDCMKSARRFGTAATPWDQAAPVDADGWPTGDFGVVVFTNIPSAAGTYLLSWRGTGTVASLSNTSLVQDAAYDAATDTSSARVVVQTPTGPQGTYGLMLRFTGTRDGARHIRLTRPGYPHDTPQVYHAPFLERLRPFRVLRFTQFLATQETRVTEWADRTLPSDATQTGFSGCALEYLVDLCNLTGKDLWVNVPDEATDDYVRELARLLKSRLDPNLAVYVEWTNEPWNWNPSYPQTRRNFDAARVEGNAGPSALNDFGATMNEGYWAWRRWARRTREVSNLFREVYGDAAMMRRVRPILSPQFGYQYMGFHQLEWLNRTYGPPRQYLYGIAGGIYFGLRPADRTRTDLTVDDILRLTTEDVDLYLPTFRVDPTFSGALNWGNLPWMPTLARYYGLRSLAYEGGPDTSGAESLDAKVAAQHDARMGEQIHRVLTTWYAEGNDVFLYYKMAGNDYDTYGSMGVWPDITQQSVKGQTLLDLWQGGVSP